MTAVAFRMTSRTPGGVEHLRPRRSWVILNADGGHPGNDLPGLRHSPLARPADGLISITE